MKNNKKESRKKSYDIKLNENKGVFIFFFLFLDSELKQH